VSTTRIEQNRQRIKLGFFSIPLYNPERTMKTIGIVSKLIFILCIPFLLLTASLGSAINSLWLYKYGFTEYGVSAATGLSETELDKAARGLIAYFNSSEEPLNIIVGKDGESFSLFNEEETIHMRDVNGLVRLDYTVLLGTFIYCIGYAAFCLFRHRGRRLARGFIRGSGLTLVLMLALGVGILLDFDSLFLEFHLLSFSNDFWSAEGYMLLLFPGGFWYDAARLVVIQIAAAAAVMLAAAVSWMAFTRRDLKLDGKV
jgi:integral membrane protein (TIGR01906 family)